MDRGWTLRAIEERRVQLMLVPRPPFRLDLTVWALRRRDHNVLDRWDGSIYRRALTLGAHDVEIAVTQVAPRENPELELTVTGDELTQEIAPAAAAAVRRMLGVNIDLTRWFEIAAAHEATADLAHRFRGLKPPRLGSVYEAVMSAIFCQQISLDFGIAIIGAWVRSFGGSPAGSGPDARLLPTPAVLAGLEAPGPARPTDQSSESPGRDRPVTCGGEQGTGPRGFDGISRYRGGGQAHRIPGSRQVDGGVRSIARPAATTRLSWRRRRRPERACRDPRSAVPDELCRGRAGRGAVASLRWHALLPPPRPWPRTQGSGARVLRTIAT